MKDCKHNVLQTLLSVAFKKICCDLSTFSEMFSRFVRIIAVKGSCSYNMND